MVHRNARAVALKERDTHNVNSGASGVLALLRDEDVVSVDAGVRTQLTELSKRDVVKNETVVLIHRKFMLVLHTF